MCSFVNGILAYHINKEEYLLGADGLSAKPAAHPSTEKKIASTTLLLQRAVEMRHTKGFSSEDVRKLACCAYQAVRQLSRSPRISSEQIKRKEKEAFWNLMGHDGVRRENNETNLFEKLVVANHIQYIVNRLGVFNGDEAVSILVNEQWVRISELSQKSCTNGIEFYHKGALVFRTKNDYILDKYFFCGDRGIVPGTPSLGTPEVIDTGVVSVPADGSYHVIVGTALVSQESPRAFGDHGYLGLVDTNGRTTYFGQFGMADSPGSSVAVAPCAHKLVGIEAYDRYIALPFTSYHVKETKLQISKEQYERLKEIAKQEPLKTLEYAGETAW